MDVLFPVLLLLLAGAQEKDPNKNPHEAQEKIDPARMHTYPKQDVTVPDFSATGWILDIGGGGEGIIGRVKGSQVVAIDLYAWGMAKTPPGPLKLVMDATDLKFLDGMFGTVTSFFTLMYIPPEKQPQAMRESCRVLKPQGQMLIWDVELPVSPDPKQDIAVYRFAFHLPAGEIVETGYGTEYPKSPMNSEYYRRLATDAGFTIEQSESSGNVFRLVLRKPTGATCRAR